MAASQWPTGSWPAATNPLFLTARILPELTEHLARIFRVQDGAVEHIAMGLSEEQPYLYDTVRNM